MTKVYGGNTFAVRQTSSSSYATTTNVTANAGGTTDIYSVTTMNNPSFTGNYWYAGATAGSPANGTTWDTRWASSSISWSSIQPGDILYLDGGTDSLVYPSTRFITVGKSGTPGLPITITVGAASPNPSGHNGKVIFDGGGGSGTAFQIRATGAGRNYIIVEGRYNGTNMIKCIDLGQGANIEDNAKGITISGLDIYNYSGQGAVMLNGASLYTIDSTTIRYCNIVSIELDASQSDGVYAQRCQRTLFHNNYIHQRNQDPNAHTDCLQAYLTNGWVVYNNFFINDSVYSPEGGGTPMIFGVQGSNKTIVANNFLYMGGIWYPTGSQNSAYWSRWYNTAMPYAWVVNNTIVVNGPNCRGAIEEYYTSMVNNIIAMFTTSSSMANLEENLPDYIYVDSTRNNFYCRNGVPNSASFSGQFIGNGHTGSVSGWSTWVSTYGGTGMTGDPKLVINVGYEPDQSVLKPDLEADSPAIDAGNNVQDIKAYINWLNAQGFDGAHPHTGEWMIPDTDIYGTLRDSNPDLGCFEYSGE
jgi:hypothetical protein